MAQFLDPKLDKKKRLGQMLSDSFRNESNLGRKLVFGMLKVEVDFKGGESESFACYSLECGYLTPERADLHASDAGIGRNSALTVRP